MNSFKVGDIIKVKHDIGFNETSLNKLGIVTLVGNIHIECKINNNEFAFYKFQIELFNSNKTLLEDIVDEV